MAETCEDSAAADVRADDIRSALEVLTSFPSPRGGEYSLAMGLAEWARIRWPELDWQVENVGSHGASLVSRAARDVEDTTLIYSHLDTSLTGDVEWDQALTGRVDHPAPLAWDEAGDVARGFGLGVAKGPAAAALVGYAAAAVRAAEQPTGSGLALLLAGSGTHRSPFENSPTGLQLYLTGVQRYLNAGHRPQSVVVAKCGPPGLLHHEPGALFVRVRIRADMLPAMAASTAVPIGGLPLSLGPVLTALNSWRDAHLAARSPQGQIAAEIGVGSIVAGRPGKPDLLPAAVELHAYVVMIDGDIAERIAAELREQLTSSLIGTNLENCPLEVSVVEEHPAAATPESASIVQRAGAAWLAERGTAPMPISGWKGSTDGVVFRSAGCHTVRLGPSPTSAVDDRRLDQIPISDLVDFARIYARLGARADQKP